MQNHLLPYSQKSIWSLQSALLVKDLKSQWLCLLLQCLESHHQDYGCTPGFEQRSAALMLQTLAASPPLSLATASQTSQEVGHRWVGQHLPFLAQWLQV